MLFPSQRRTHAAARALVALLLAASAAGAAAHDTWLALEGTPAAGLYTLALSTGSQFPLQESGHAMDGLVRSGCVDRGGRTAALRPREALPRALLLRVRVENEADPVLSCWAETRPHRAELTPELVDVYLKDIQAPPAVVEAWQAMRKLGASWRESYTKYARIELGAAAPGAGGLAALRTGTGAGLEILPLGGEALRARAESGLQVLEDGKPAVDLAVQFVSERNPLGVWRRTDAQGRVSFAFPFGGRWLVRATRLAPPRAGEGEWRSRFSTLIVEALPAAAH
jgi:hypothetical protein